MFFLLFLTHLVVRREEFRSGQGYMDQYYLFLYFQFGLEFWSPWYSELILFLLQYIYFFFATSPVFVTHLEVRQEEFRSEWECIFLKVPNEAKSFFLSFNQRLILEMNSKSEDRILKNPNEASQNQFEFNFKFWSRFYFRSGFIKRIFLNNRTGKIFANLLLSQCTCQRRVMV